MDTLILLFVVRQVYATGRSNVYLRIESIATWIFNAILYAIVICLVYYYAVAQSFQDWSLYEFGTAVYTGLLLSLQLKVGFLHHQWNWVHTLSMAVSVGGMFIMFPVCSDIFSDYIYISSYVYDQPLYWLFGVFSMPVFTILIDMVGHYGRLLVWPTQEMLYREIEHKVREGIIPHVNINS